MAITIEQEMQNKESPILDYRVECSCGFKGESGSIKT